MRFLLPWIVVLVMVAPMFVAAGSLAARGWHPTSDLAQAELRMQAFWENPPEIGAAGRIGDPARQGAHPGPAAWWAMYPAYALGGSSPGALSVAVALVAALFAAGAVSMAHLFGGVRAALCVAVCLAIVVRVLGPTPFVEPWNPYLGIFPFALFLTAVWGVVAGRSWALVVAAFAGSFAVQQHVGYIPLVAVLGAGSTIVVAARLRHPPVHAAVGALAGTAAMSMAMWALPIHQQLRDPEGNLGLIWNSFSSPTEDVIGLGSALRVVSGIFGAVGTWAVRSDVRPVERSEWWSFALLGVAWMIAAGWAWTRRGADPRWRSAASLHAVIAVAFVVGVAATSRIFGEVFDYLLEWMRIIAGFAVAASLWTMWEVAVDRSRDGERTPSRLVAPLLVVTLVTVSLWSIATFPDVETPGRRLSDQMGELASVTDDLDPDQSYVVRWSDPVALGALGFGTVLELERAGFDVGTDPVFSTAVLPSRVMPADRADRSLWVVSGDLIDLMRDRSDVTQLAYVDVRTPAERAKVEEVRDVVERRLLEVGGEELAATLDLGYWNVILHPDYPEDLADEIAELGDLGLPTAIFEGPPDLITPSTR